MTRWDRIRKAIHKRRREGPDDADLPGVPAEAEDRRPSWLLDITVALLLAVADAGALVGVALLLFPLALPHTPPPAGSSLRSQSVSLLPLAIIWFLPAVFALSALTQSRLRMPFTATVQVLFLALATLFSIGLTRALLSSP
ncbi:hypothetical protein OK074_1700 [Actinobacteria bacterium OK074]|nr:hypothetical protein OK074_1700 [Actinobacteria bacterium OK074]